MKPQPYMAAAKHPHHLTPAYIESAFPVLFGDNPDSDVAWHPKAKVQPRRRCIVHPVHRHAVDRTDRRIVIGDGLVLDWWGSCFMNPPYGRIIARWTERAVQHEEGPVLALLPAKTSTAWWQRDVMRARAVCFLNGRLQFGDGELDDPFCTMVQRGDKLVPRNQAPFPSALVLWDRSWRALGADDLDAAYGAFGTIMLPYQT